MRVLLSEAVSMSGISRHRRWPDGMESESSPTAVSEPASTRKLHRSVKGGPTRVHINSSPRDPPFRANAFSNPRTVSGMDRLAGRRGTSRRAEDRQ